jgi:diaminohydroxyphosphoribosylaminopyrimidine deaminase/5-amino-6-(5-phosphoribosylamino)uracil reductase
MLPATDPGPSGERGGRVSGLGPAVPGGQRDHGASDLAGASADEWWMAHAVAVAWSARRRVAPRPWVGAVVVPAGVEFGGEGVFVGATDGRSGPHAEVVALRAAGAAAAGATLYCTLEPCSHHGATPPCAEAILTAGVARVVVALEDPDPRVAGSGVSLLRDSGVEVVVGCGAADAAAQLAPYLHHRRTGRPWVVLKWASTLDGRVAAADGTSQWITSPAARIDAHGLRADSDAVVVGAGTVRADDPALTVRLPGWERVGDDGPGDRRQPLRVVLGSAPADARVQPALEHRGSIADLLDDLGARGVLQVLVEGGPTVAHAVHSAGLVNRYVLYLAAALAGGDDGAAALGGPGASGVADLWRGELLGVRRVGPDLRVDLAPATPAPVNGL